ncbi:T9SS type A sorting domain-containing protein [Gracilimonas mengyeensis]|uniref:Por secretion system C-terminal sorting domain-containing protein n=1 Tax=Gracilimonas mengyeensis TaxID=1302730 RepID=A0A521DE00_9BACT|nr:T9SS type A sorting domain-containing protein [Gracilimonas mengyeensis]SMO69818.1 Por secretion system C-terminal sorting domain-containing protein [Gracilimonas mengyeensis]
MHKYRPQLKFLAVLLLFSGYGISILAQHQSHDRDALLEVQQAFVRGDVDVNQAALQQFRLIFEPEASGIKHQKCATPAFIFLKNHRDELSPQTLQKINALVKSNTRSAADMQHNYISPSGKFDIYYDTSGPDAVPTDDLNNNGIPDYVEKAAFAADSSYRHQVLALGFTNPIPSGSTYEIILQHDVAGYYGRTNPAGDEPAGTNIYVENDFEGFRSNTHPEGDAIGALYATIAHEFKHAIQYRQHQWRGPAGRANWREMDATLMEEVVFDDVNDYYNYIKRTFTGKEPNFSSLFYNPARSVPVAYNYVSWMIYYSEMLGNEFWVDVWDLIEADNTKGIDEAMIETLPFYGSNFDTDFVRNHLWHFASGANAPATNYGFDEKSAYPTPNTDNALASAPSEEIPVQDVNKLAARYYEIIPAANDRGYVNLAVEFDSTTAGIGALLYLKNGEVVETADAGRNKGQVYLPTNVLWEEVVRMGIVIANFSLTDTTRNLSLLVGSNQFSFKITDPNYVELPDQIAISQNYPNPFNPRTNIEFELPQSAFVKLDVFDVTGQKVQTLINRYLQVGGHQEVFDGSGLSSGVYFYRLRIDNQVYIKKMTLIK